MSTIPALPVPTPRPRPNPGGPAGARPAGAAGTRPAGAAGSHPRMRSNPGSGLDGAEHRKYLVTAFVELFLEVEAGRRPPQQLRPLLAPMLYARLNRVWHRGGPPGRVVSVSVIAGGADCFDAIAVVVRGRRSGAVSLRLARGAGRWRIEELARPEDGPLPGPEHRVALDDRCDDDDDAIPRVILRGDGPRGDADARHGRPAPSRAEDTDWLLPLSTG
jgi:hypothetical protein